MREISIEKSALEKAMLEVLTQPHMIAISALALAAGGASLGVRDPWFFIVGLVVAAAAVI